jgi:Na+/H+ antiporter NhaD/arsenite permease-like protein
MMSAQWSQFFFHDATAVVLTPAVLVATRAAKVKDLLPYLLIRALIANAASFVLPISNPANLVIFRDHMLNYLKAKIAAAPKGVILGDALR